MSTSAAPTVPGLHLLWLKRALHHGPYRTIDVLKSLLVNLNPPTLDCGTLFIPEEAKSSANASKIVSSLISPVVALPAN